MRNQGIGSWPARRARVEPHKPAIIFDGAELTYRTVHERSVRLANALRDLGVAHGDRVAYLGPNHPSFAETLFAAGMLGATLVPLNVRLTAQDHTYILRDSGARVLIRSEEWGAPSEALCRDTSVERVIALGARDPSGYEALLASGPDTAIDEPVTLDDLCMIQYTSGTTGHPKGVMLTHGNLTWNSINMLIDVDMATDEVTLLAAPMFHSAGMNNCFLTTFLKGGTLVMMAAWRPEEALDLIAAHRVTHILGVPTMFLTLSQSPRWESADMSSVRTLTCGSAPLARSLIETYLERGFTFLQGYGMTEASSNATFQRTHNGAEKVGSVGGACFFTDLRIVDPSGNEIGPGEKGEVLLHGPNVMPGYWGMPEATARVIDGDGWLRTGDAAVRDENGLVFIADRIKDMIITGGENVYPAEVEDAIYRHSAVKECAVIGVEDEHWGEIVHAVVVPHDGTRLDADELRTYLRGELATYKIPKTYQFVERLPRNATGKLEKKMLRRGVVSERAPGRRA